MDIAMIGLGRMGSNLSRRLLRDGHRVVAYDLDPFQVEALAEEGAEAGKSLSDVADKLVTPRAVWVMVPAAVTGKVIEDLAENLDPGDVVIDGGNSFYGDAPPRAGALAQRGISFLDVGTSGGVFGLERGFCLMIGGEEGDVSRLEPIFRSLAPGVESAGRTAGRTEPPAAAEHGYLHCGPSGAGHFVKMIHNGIEYGVMAAYAEGLNILRHAGDSPDGPRIGPVSLGAAGPGYDLDIPAIAEVWRRGSVISSWLLDLTAAALVESPRLSEFTGMVSDSGEGRWTVRTAVEEGVPAPVLSAALYGRFDSRGRDDFANQVLSAMRHQFGGHEEAE